MIASQSMPKISFKMTQNDNLTIAIYWHLSEANEAMICLSVLAKSKATRKHYFLQVQLMLVLHKTLDFVNESNKLIWDEANRNL